MLLANAGGISSSSSNGFGNSSSAGGYDMHATALAMELVVILAASAKLAGRLQAAGVIPAVAAFLVPVGVGKETSTRSSLVQNGLIVLSSMVRFAGEDDGERGEGSTELACPLGRFDRK